MNNEKLVKIQKEVERQLSELSNLQAFTIGKTEDCQERFKTFYQPQGYQSYIELAYGNPQVVNEGEIFLIDYFQNRSEWKGKCANDHRGGAGNENANHLYVTAKCKMHNIDDLDDELSQEDWKPINLD